VIRQYIYKPEELGRQDWPSGTLRLEGIEVTANPDEADVVVCPGSLEMFRNPDDLYKLPFFRGREAKHCFFDVSDHETQYYQPSMFIRCNLRPWNLASDPNSIQMAWPVENYAECVDVSVGGFKYDVSFQGWNWSDVRKASTHACVEHPTLKCDIATYSDFCGYIFDQPEGIRRRAEFRRSMKESRIMLCPESIPGVFPYRFFEAMSAGRVPLLIGSDFVLPFVEEIPYHEFCLCLSREGASLAGIAVRNFLDRTSDERLIEMGKKARSYWLKWLNSSDWPSTMAYAVRNKLGVTVSA
jgi:hypothetical protein